MTKLISILVAVMFGFGSVAVLAADDMAKDAAKTDTAAPAKSKPKAKKKAKAKAKADAAPATDAK